MDGVHEPTDDVDAGMERSEPAVRMPRGDDVVQLAATIGNRAFGKLLRGDGTSRPDRGDGRAVTAREVVRALNPGRAPVLQRDALTSQDAGKIGAIDPSQLLPVVVGVGKQLLAPDGGLACNLATGVSALVAGTTDVDVSKGFIERTVPTLAFTAGGISRTAANISLHGWFNPTTQELANLTFELDYAAQPAAGFEQMTAFRGSSLKLTITPNPTAVIDNGTRYLVFNLTEGRFDPEGPGDVTFSADLWTNAYGHTHVRNWKPIDNSSQPWPIPDPTVTFSPVPGVRQFSKGPPLMNGIWIDIEPALHTSRGGPIPPGGGPCTDPNPRPIASAQPASKK